MKSNIIYVQEIQRNNANIKTKKSSNKKTQSYNCDSLEMANRSRFFLRRRHSPNCPDR